MNAILIATLYGDIFGTGSVTEAADGTLLVQSAPSRYVAWIAAYFIVAPLSFWLWRKFGGRYAPAVFFASLSIPLIIVPGIYTESIHVSPEAVVAETGFWFSPECTEISLTHLDRIVDHEMLEGGRFPHMTRYWAFKYADGALHDWHLSDLADANRASIAVYLRRHAFRIDEE